ncbi:MAG TPA: apolipoprotein N-acyltransferase [Acidobacteriaceae bacterium]|jgi:apolipoprotein N-acyltransferase|nr:apolipoprotein N-acyltransferase [Acidobacteriaceae bacterium]
MRKIPLRLYLLAVLSAVLQAIPFPIAGPVPLWRRAFCWFCLVPLLLALLGARRSGRPLRASQTAWLGYVCGVVWYLLNCYWIYPTMHLYGDLSKAASVGVLILFALYLGLYLALFGFIFGVLRRVWSVRVALLSAPLLWVAVEFARARITGFPWDLLGYTQVDNLLLTRMVPWTGVFGLSLLIAIVNMLWTLPAAKIRRQIAIPGVVVAALAAGAATWIEFHPPYVAPAATSASAILLQENLSVGAGLEKGTESKDAMLNSFAALSRHPSVTSTFTNMQKPQLIVWPESPASFLDSDPAYRDFMEQLAHATGTPIVADDLSLGPRTEYGDYSLYNSASFFNADGSYGGRYDKVHLVPFGEYVPYKPLFFFTGHLLDGLPFVPGTQRKVFHAGGHRYGVFICYESIFGDEIRRFVLNGAEVLVNVSDDGWYGDTSAPWEHLDMARMRTIENQRWLLRATNTGVTAAIDPDGRITQSMPRHTRGSLLVGFNYNSYETFYTRYGDWLAWICAVLTAILLGVGVSRSRSQAPAQ